MTIQEWLTEYGQSHQNPTNKKVHYVCVPLIFFTIVGFLYLVPLFDLSGVKITLAHVALLLVALYYFRLSPPLSLGMLLYSVLCLTVCQIISTVVPLGIICLIIFVVAWIFQFWGHSVEGKKPSFLKDLQFLLIGPAWIMSFIYNQFGIKI